MKVTGKHSWPKNVPSLIIPELPKDSDKTTDSKVVKYDDRLKNDQKCTLAMFSGMAEVVDLIMESKGKKPKMIRAGGIHIDFISMCGFLHNDFNSIRLEEFKQTIKRLMGKCSQRNLMKGTCCWVRHLWQIKWKVVKSRIRLRPS